MTPLQERLLSIRSTIPNAAELVAVSKFHPTETLMEAYQMGQRIFGESRVQELCGKQEAMPRDVQWHFIGPLQRNKVKYLAPFIAMIHSVDSVALLETIDQQAARLNRQIDILLEFHIATEESKQGFTLDDAIAHFGQTPPSTYPNVRFRGVMGMASFSDDHALVEGEFAQLKVIFETLKQAIFTDEPLFDQLSMGMSNDYPIALRHGATLVRIGTSIFIG